MSESFKDVIKNLNPNEVVECKGHEYYYTFCNYEHDTEFYTYNVYHKRFLFEWSAFSYESKSKEECVEKCKDFIEQSILALTNNK